MVHSDSNNFDYFDLDYYYDYDYDYDYYYYYYIHVDNYASECCLTLSHHCGVNSPLRAPRLPEHAPGKIPHQGGHHQAKGPAQKAPRHSKSTPFPSGRTHPPTLPPSPGLQGLKRLELKAAKRLLPS